MQNHGAVGGVEQNNALYMRALSKNRTVTAPANTPPLRRSRSAPTKSTSVASGTRLNEYGLTHVSSAASGVPSREKPYSTHPANSSSPRALGFAESDCFNPTLVGVQNHRTNAREDRREIIALFTLRRMS